MEPIKQSTYESCLSCCLLMLVESNNEDEIEIWKHGWKFNYLSGQLNYVSSQYGKKIKAYIENEYYFNQLQLEKDKGVQLVNPRVDLDLLSDLLEKGKVIIYLDVYYLQHILHAPHFVLGIKKVGDNIEIIDPADGLVKRIPVKVVGEAIESLRSYLKYSPVFITKDI